MLMPFANYPVRPRMEEGESLAGYISRFREANGHGMPGEICNTLRVLYRGTRAKAPAAFDLMQSMLGESVTLDRSWWLGRAPLEGERGISPPAWPTLQFDSPNFCPACIQESGFHFALWELPLVEACPLHQCALQSACPKCSEKLAWMDLLPNWRCRCGEPIAAMPLAAAKPAALGLAQALASSNDLILPSHFDRHFFAPDDGQHHLEAVYKGLEWGTALRVLFFKRGSIMGELNFYERQTGKRRARWGFWERRLIGDSTEKLISRVLRAQRKYFNSKRLLKHVFPSDGLAQAKAFVRESAPGVVQTKIQKTLDCYLADYAADLPLSLLVWFSEAKHSEQRITYMHQFATWWAVLAARIGDLDPAMRRVDLVLNQRAQGLGASLHEIFVVDVLNLLLDAASQRLDVESFCGLTYWWRIPPALRDVSNPEELFLRIGLHLASASEGEILFVHDLVQRAVQGK